MSQDCCAAWLTHNLVFQLKYLQTANQAGGDKIPWGWQEKNYSNKNSQYSSLMSVFSVG